MFCGEDFPYTIYLTSMLTLLLMYDYVDYVSYQKRTNDNRFDKNVYNTNIEIMLAKKYF